MLARRSLFSVLTFAIVTVVIVIMGAKAYLHFQLQKEILQQEIEISVQGSKELVSKNIQSLIEAYAVNEYTKVLRNELVSSDYKAVILFDKNMTQLMGENDFYVGFINGVDGIMNFETSNANHQAIFQSCQFQFDFYSIQSSGDEIGKLLICASDSKIQEELESTVRQTLIETVIAGFVLIVLIYFIVKTYSIKPIQEIVSTLEKQDDLLLPVQPVKGNGLAEIDFLADRINTMVSTARNSKAQIIKERKYLSDIIWGTNVGTWDWNVQTDETIFNEKWAEIIGYELEELQPTTIETWMEYTHPDDLKKSEELLNKCFTKEKQFYECECRMRHKNGQWIWVLDRGKIVEWTEDGKPLRMAGTHTDITVKVEVEQALQEAEQQLKRALKIADAGNWSYDVKSDVFTFDDNFFEIFKSSYEEVGSYQMTSLEYAKKFCHPDDMHVVQDVIQNALSSDVENFSHILDHRIKCSDGSIGYITVRFYTIRDEHGNVIRLEGINQNITQLKNAQIALDNARREAEEANLAKSDFLANMSHELRTPMMGIRGVLDLMRDDERIMNYAKGLLDDLDTSSSVLMGLLDDVLDLSKIEAGKLNLEYSVCEPANIINSLAKLFSAKASQKGITIETNASNSFGIYCGLDDLRFRQILSNLINNAVKFTEQGEVRIDMEVLHQGEINTLFVQVKDTGIGMPEEAQKHIFERFRQAEAGTARKYGGSGLGLAISSELTHLFEGSLEVESHEGVGTTFTLKIPINMVDAVHTEETSIKLPKLNILLAEDNVVNQKVVSTMLRKKGHTVDVVENGLNAVSRAKETQFDLILMDMHMPEMDGLEATKIIRREKGLNSDTSIIAFTADAVTSHQTEFMNAGVNGIIPKPVSFEKLNNEIARILGLAQE